MNEKEKQKRMELREETNHTNYMRRTEKKILD